MTALPKGYKIREGLEFDTQLGRFRWLPEPKDLFYFEETNTIFEYQEWLSPAQVGWIFLMDGYAKVKDIKDNDTFITDNMNVRKCIPIVKAD